MVKNVLLPSKECDLRVNIRKSPGDSLYVCEGFLKCGAKEQRLGMTRLVDFVKDFERAFVSKKDSFVTLFGSTCAVSVQHLEDHVIFKYVDADNRPIGNSILYELDQKKWIETLKDLAPLLEEK